MKELTILIPAREAKNFMEDLSYLENKCSIQIPEYLKLFMTKYAGCKTHERVYRKKNSGFESVTAFLYIKAEDRRASMEAIYEGHLYYGIKGFIPFGIDSGGWDYNVSINTETYGQVWVNQFDSGEENSVVFVANSFEEFIDGFMTEEKAIELGY